MKLHGEGGELGAGRLWERVDPVLMGHIRSYPALVELSGGAGPTNSFQLGWTISWIAT